MSRVVITGVGMITPLGSTVAASWCRMRGVKADRASGARASA